MSRVYAGAMMTIMALCVFGIALPIGGVNPEVAAPAYLLAALLGMLWAGRFLFARELTWHSSPMHWPVAMFLVYAVARYLGSPLEYAARVELFQVGVCALIYFVCATQFTRPSDRTFFLVALMILAVFESGYGVWQAMSKSDAVFQWLRPEGYRGRASGTFIYPNHLAGFLELVLGLVLARAALVRRESEKLEKSIILKVLTIYVVVMVVVGIVFSRSRAGWAAVVAGLSVFPFLGDWRPRVSFPRLVLVLVVISGMMFCLWKIDFTRTHFLRTLNLDGDANTVSLSDPTLGGRVLMWKGTLKMIQEHPLFGTGGGSWQWIYQQHKDPAILSRPEHAHNDFLNLTSDYGLVGLIILGPLFVGFWRHGLRLSHGQHSPEKQAFAIGAMVSVTSILLHSWFDLTLHAPANPVVLSSILGVVAAMDGGSGTTSRRELAGWQR